ncbi:MAG: WG repeat-containing protein [Flavobacteriales bacterium]|nr:WG repeat-containing protein [Flavobacteriales bacterium]
MRFITGFILLFAFTSWSQKAFKDGTLYGYRIGDEVIIPAQFEYAADFTEGFGCVRENGKWGYVDADKNWLFSPEFDKAGPFIGQFAKIKKDGKIGLIEISGKRVLAPEYDQILIDWNGIVLFQSGKRGLYQENYPIIPCKYASVGKNGEYLYGQKENGLFDIYTINGLLLTDQEHSFSSWRINQDSCTVAKQNGKYGLFSVSNNDWILQPEFGYVQKLRTEEYFEYDANGNQQKYSFVYAVFKNEPESIKYLDEQSSGKNSIVVLKASSFAKIYTEVLGYQQETTGYGYNKEFDYRLTLENNKEIMLNTELGIIEKPVDTKYMGYVISRTSQSAELKLNNELILSANSIEFFKYTDRIIDENGQEIEVAKDMNLAVLLVKSDAGCGLYSLRGQSFLIENLPLSTSFNSGFSELEYGDFYIHYQNNGLSGVCVSDYDATSMTYGEIEGLGIWQLVKYRKRPDDKMILASVERLSNELCQGDDFKAKQFGGGDYFVEVLRDGKVGIYDRSNTVTKFDELIDIDNANIFGYRIESKYGVLELRSELETGAIFSELPQIEEESYYPYGFIKKNEEWIGLDGNTYQFKTMMVPVEDENGWGIGWENWESDSENDMPNHIFISESRYAEVRESEIYPNFRVLGKNGKWGVINNFCDTLVPLAFEDIGYADLDISWEELLPHEDVVSAYTKNGGAIYSTVHGVILPEGYDYTEPDYDMFDWSIKAIRVSKKRMNGYYILGVGETIPPLYKSLNHAYDLGWESDTLIARNKSGKYGFLGIMGDTVLPFEYSNLNYFSYESCYEYLEYPLISLEIGKKEGVYYARKNKVLVPAIFDEILSDMTYYDEEVDEEIFLNGFTTQLKKKYGFYDYHGKELLPPIFDEIKAIRCGYDFGSDILVYGNFEGKCYVNYSSGVDSTKAIAFNEENYFDRIIGTVAFRMESGGIYAYDFLTSKETTGVSELTIEGGSYDIYIKDGKYGAKDKEGNIIVEPIYENGNFMGSRNEVMIGFENGTKYFIYVFNNERYSEDEW